MGVALKGIAGYQASAEAQRDVVAEVHKKAHYAADIAGAVVVKRAKPAPTM